MNTQAVVPGAVKVLLILVCAFAIAGCSKPAAEGDKTLPGLTYESLARLPDLRGWWRQVGGTSIIDLGNNTGAFSPEARAAAELVNSRANVPSNGEECWPAQFTGHNGGLLEDVEFLLTPGRLTITNESGMIRRIPFDGQPMREEPEEFNAGTSVARWEGSVLHIETIALKSNAGFLRNVPGWPTVGSNARVTETLRLNDKQQIVIDTELVASELLAEPLKFTTVYEREPNHVLRDHDTCSYNGRDRTRDPKTGLQRFDLTPPADLPPPPPKE